MKFKKAMASLLAAAMTMSMAVSTLAATPSPVIAPTPVEGYVDTNTQDHSGNTVTSQINANEGTVVKAEYTSGKTVVFSVARNSNNEQVAITTVGNGKGVFNSKNGRKITTAVFSSAKNMVVKKNAFKGSKVKTVKIGTKVTLNKNAFKGTKQKKVTIRFTTKKASSLKLKKGALTGLTKVTVKGLSKKEYNKLLKSAKKAGIKTSIFKRG